MRLVLLGIAGLGSILASSASAQCRQFSVGTSAGAIDRGRAIVSTAGGGSPMVRFFSKSPDGWVVEDSFVMGDTYLIYDLVVALDGDRAIAGTPESAVQRGRAFVFDRSGTQWIPTELTAPSIGPGDFFGSAVALDGDVAVVGADHWPIGGGDGVPIIHVFEHPGATWNEVAQFPIDAGSIALEGPTFAVGDNSAFPGHVKIYERIVGAWTPTSQLSAGTAPLGSPRFGSCVALQGDTLAVGASWPGPDAGYVDVFRRDASGAWNFVQHIVPVDPVPFDQFGGAVALSGSTLLVGAPGHDQGRVYRFEHDGAAFVEVGSFGPQSGHDNFGRLLAFQREDALIHAGWSDVAFYRLGFAETSSFCPATPNSTGARGVLAAEGCDSLTGVRLSLVARRLPPTALGLVFFGANTAQQPLGDGTLCIGSPLFRLPVAISDPSGTLVHDVDFSTRPGSLIAAGRTWKFQTLFRDPQSAGAALNLTNALAIRITP